VPGVPPQGKTILVRNVQVQQTGTTPQEVHKAAGQTMLPGLLKAAATIRLGPQGPRAAIARPGALPNRSVKA
tara:strand:+ start:9800 stop:10015 length:216 start_codon:yes stop_codon:yes gene_type:complete